LNTSSDNWVAGGAYEFFMGRWSRQVAHLFLDWLALGPGLNWLDVGCGPGALSQTICKTRRPQSLLGCDPSSEFVTFARDSLAGYPATFVVANSDNLPARDGGFDVVVSGLVLNFLPRPQDAVASMSHRLKPGGTLAAYVWDYAAGMEFLRIFWEEAAALDPRAADQDEGRRFPLCHPERLANLLQQVGIAAVSTTSLEIETVFANFDDFWSPFLAGTGPAPSYVAALDADARSQLALRLKRRLHVSADGSIRLAARAFGVRGLHAG
jgi:SAM-dependent methyltransferase